MAKQLVFTVELLSVLSVVLDLCLQMKYATRKASADSRQPLYYTKCYELVNYYLGFNSWTTSVQLVSRDGFS